MVMQSSARAALPVTLPAALPPAVPVLPERDEARNWMTQELTRGPYLEAEPNFLEQIVAFVLEWLGSLLSNLRPLGAGPGTLLLAAGAVVLIAAAVLLLRPRLNARRKRQNPGIFPADAVRTAGEHRNLADDAARLGDWDLALTERLRAVIRSAEERGIIDSQPGRTAGEAGAALRDAFGVSGDAIPWLAGKFNGVHYGDQKADGADYRRAEALDQALTQTRPAAQDPAGLAVPR